MLLFDLFDDHFGRSSQNEMFVPFTTAMEPASQIRFHHYGWHNNGHVLFCHEM